MFYKSYLLFYLTLWICKSSLGQTRINPLNGKHLRIVTNKFSITLFIIRNATNHIVGVDGVLIHHMKALAKLLNFSYDIIPEWTLPIEDRSPFKGAISYILDGDADYLISSVLATVPRFKVLDFPASWYEGTNQCLVPYPKKELNTAATIKPFALEVWILIGTAVLITIFSLRLLLKPFTCLRSANSSTTATTINNNSEAINYFVWGNLVSQGQRIASSRLVVRFVAGAWCVACFFLVQSYSSTLTSHLMSPNQKPIANSVHQLANFSDVSITVNADLGLKNLMLGAETGNLKLLGDKLKRNSNSLCNTTDDCLTTVKTNGYTAFCAPTMLCNSIMADDFKDKGTCQYFLVDDILSSYSVHTVLPKNSPYTEIISQGILQLKEAGLYTKWFSLYSSSPWQCKLNSKKDRDKNLQKLSLRHLVSAFLILLCGSFASVVAFTLEKLVWILSKRRI